MMSWSGRKTSWMGPTGTDQKSMFDSRRSNGSSCRLRERAPHRRAGASVVFAVVNRHRRGEVPEPLGARERVRREAAEREATDELVAVEIVEEARRSTLLVPAMNEDGAGDRGNERDAEERRVDEREEEKDACGPQVSLEEIPSVRPERGLPGNGLRRQSEASRRPAALVVVLRDVLEAPRVERDIDTARPERRTCPVDGRAQADLAAGVTDRKLFEAQATHGWVRRDALLAFDRRMNASSTL